MILTSWFARSGRLPNAISIARTSPKWFSGERLLSLAPPWALINKYKNFDLTTGQFKEEYLAGLSNLNPRLVAPFCQGKVLCCWEEPPEYCHRYALVEWFVERGFEAKEL